MTTKDIVFRHIKSTSGKVNLQDLTEEILKNDPKSRWDDSHWSFYRSQITSDNGRYAHLFSPEIKANLKLQRSERVKRRPADNHVIHSRKSISKNTSDWPTWNVPSEEEQWVLARVLLPYIKILDPSIVLMVAEENNKYLATWSEKLTKVGIKPDIYLWQSSPVTFPGVRRHVGSTETNLFRSSPKQSKGADALFLDDNTFPKQIWSFALRNKPHGMKNPANYSLAHILDHKDFNSRNVSELKGFEATEDRNLFAGLYTSCANVVYIPTSFIKPTDHNSKIRQLLIQIVNKYYGKICNLLPHNLSFNLDSINDDWMIDNFPDPTVVGDKKNIINFLKYRNSVIDERLKQLATSSGAIGQKS